MIGPEKFAAFLLQTMKDLEGNTGVTYKPVDNRPVGMQSVQDNGMESCNFNLPSIL